MSFEVFDYVNRYFEYTETSRASAQLYTSRDSDKTEIMKPYNNIFEDVKKGVYINDTLHLNFLYVYYFALYLYDTLYNNMPHSIAELNFAVLSYNKQTSNDVEAAFKFLKTKLDAFDKTTAGHFGKKHYKKSMKHHKKRSRKHKNK